MTQFQSIYLYNIFNQNENIRKKKIRFYLRGNDISYINIDEIYNRTKNLSDEQVKTIINKAIEYTINDKILEENELHYETKFLRTITMNDINQSINQI